MKHQLWRFLLIFSLPVLGFIIGCRPGADDQQKLLPIVPVSTTYTETGDLDALKKRGFLRILIQRFDQTYLPRAGNPFDYERELAAGFARSIGLKPELVTVESFDELIPALLAGKGDLVAANLTVLESRKKEIAFTAPVDHSYERLVGRADEKAIRTISDLKNRTIAVQDKTSYLETARDLARRCPGLKIQKLSGKFSPDIILDRLATGRIDLTIMDSNILDINLNYRSDIKPILNVTDKRPLAWGVRYGNPQLLEALNRFLRQEGAIRRRENVYRDDWPGIQRRKTLRVLTRNNEASYFMWRGELLGFEYDLVREFARQNGLHLKVVVASSVPELISLLMEGRGDLIASILTPTEDRVRKGLAFSRPYGYAAETVVTRANDRKLNKLADLAGRTVVVRQSSTYWQTLKKLNNGGLKIKLKAAPETMETEDIIRMVADGDYDLTVADSHILGIEQVWNRNIKAAFPLGDPRPYGWAVRAKDAKLLAAINAFWKKEYRSTFYNLTYRKYFKNKKKARMFMEDKMDIKRRDRISPYDNIVKHYAGEYDFDWRLIVSQMYQESRFNPKVKSATGAQGLLQVMPRTAKEMGFQNLADPKTGIHAGVKYLDKSRNRFETDTDEQERIWFALAAYNAGAGHVNDACRLAAQKGWDSRCWFDHVERAMGLLSKPQYARRARHGYVRGEEPVTYVRRIHDRYWAYAVLVTNEVARH